MKDLKSIAAELSKGKNTEENLEKYIKGISSMYNTLGYIKLSMNYYTMYDMNRELTETDEMYDTMYDEFVEIVGKLLKGRLDVPCIENFRQRIINVMDVVVAYIDRLRIYEHILNRVEYRFKKSDFDAAYYNTYLTNDLMHYILSDRDNVVINSKIANILGQLPVRISKNSYFEHIRDAFSLYHGAQKGTIDDFKYSLATTAMLSEPANFNEIFPDMPEIFENLKNADYANIDSDEYAKLYECLQTGAEKMNRCADLFVLMASMVNDIYTIVLSAGLGLGDNAEVELAKEIIIELYESDAEGNKLSESLSDKFISFEGKQEKIMDAISGADYVIHEFPEVHAEKLEASGRSSDFDILAKVAKLQSGSEFVQLHGDEDYSRIPDDSYADNACEELISDMSGLFENVSIQERRAVMATVLSQLPVFFNNTEDIQSYINISLMQCSDNAEQKATVEILKSLMAG